MKNRVKTVIIACADLMALPALTNDARHVEAAGPATTQASVPNADIPVLMWMMYV